MNYRNIVGFVLLTLVIAYYVIFTLAEGYGIAWCAIFGIAAYVAAGWLLLVPERKWSATCDGRNGTAL